MVIYHLFTRDDILFTVLGFVINDLKTYLRLYPLNLYLSNDAEDIFVFLSYKVAAKICSLRTPQEEERELVYI